MDYQSSIFLLCSPYFMSRLRMSVLHRKLQKYESTTNTTALQMSGLQVVQLVACSQLPCLQGNTVRELVSDMALGDGLLCERLQTPR